MYICIRGRMSRESLSLCHMHITPSCLEVPLLDRLLLTVYIYPLVFGVHDHVSGLFCMYR